MRQFPRLRFDLLPRNNIVGVRIVVGDAAIEFPELGFGEGRGDIVHGGTVQKGVHHGDSVGSGQPI